MDREGGKEEEQSFSESLGVVLAKVFMKIGRLIQRVGQFVGRRGLYFKYRFKICSRNSER